MLIAFPFLGSKFCKHLINKKVRRGKVIKRMDLGMGQVV